ncbi:MAG: MFS transporter [Cuniculiplasma sp.]
MAKIASFLYRFLLSKMLASIISTAFTVFFLWYIVESFHSVFLAGMIATIYLAVQLITSVPIGHIIDRINSTVIGLIGSVFVLASLFFILIGYSLLTVYTGTMLITLGVTMKGDSFSATMKKHLHEDQFSALISINEAAIYTSTLLGTALGGVSIIFFQYLFPYILIALATLSIALSMPVAEVKSKIEGDRVVGELASVIGFYRKIVGFLALAFVLNGLFMALDVYSSGLFDLVLHSNVIFYTIFVASISIGGIFGSFLANALKNRTSSPMVLSLLVLVYAPIFLFLGISRSAVLDILDATFLGLLLPVINVPLNTKLMKIVPSNIYGKVMAFLRVFIGGSTPVMAAVFSFVAIFLQVNVIFFYIGILLFPLTGLAFFVLPRFMGLTAESFSNKV